MSIEEQIRVTGADQAAQDVNRVADAEKRVGDAADDAGAQATGAEGRFSRFTGVFRRGLSVLHSFAGGLVGVGGIVAALNATREAAEHARKAIESYADAMAATLALSKDPKLLEIATRASIESGRSIKEVGPALFSIVSGTAGATVEQQQALLKESLEIGKAEPQVPLGQISELLIRLFNVSGRRLTPQQIQNLAIKAEDLGQIDIGQLARFLPRPLKPGQVAGLELSETAAMFALISQVLKPELASTATERIIMQLAAPTDESTKVLDRLGVDRSGGVLQTVAALAEINRRTPLTAGQLRGLVGEGPGAAGLPVLLEQYGQFLLNVEAISGALAEGAPDLGREKVKYLRETLPGFTAVERTRQEQQRIETRHREDEEATLAQLIRERYERYLMEEGYIPARRWLLLQGFDLSRWLGASGETALRFSMPGPTGPSALTNLPNPDLWFEKQQDINMILNVTNTGTNLATENPEAYTPAFPDVGE